MGDSKTVQTPIEDEQQVLKDSVTPKEVSTKSVTAKKASIEPKTAKEEPTESETVDETSVEPETRDDKPIETTALDETSAESTISDEASAESTTIDGAPAESQQISLSSKELGRRGERAAARFLERKGYEILDTNWACFAGEADIIALDGSTLCFIEVKTRTGVQKGFPAEAVDAKKRARYEKIAACYLQNYEKPDIYVRFDVISILVLSESRAFLRLHTNAFSCDH